MKKTLYFVSLLFLAVFTVAPNTFAAEIKVIASNAVKESFHELIPHFEKVSGHTVNTIWGGTVAITKRVDGGEVVDIVVIPASGIDGLIKRGKLATGSRVDFAKSNICVATRPGAPRPDISSGEALKKSLLSAKSIVLSFGPSSFYLLDMFKKMGIADELKPKIKRLAPGLSVGEALAKGEGDLGFTQISEFLTITGIEYIGPLPADVQKTTVFSMGLHKNAPPSEAAGSLIKFLTSSEAANVIRHTGMEPAFGM